jgi:hypothetical protein
MEAKRKEAAKDLIGKYVILRPEYEDKEIEGGILDRDGRTFTPNIFSLRNRTIGYVTDVREDGLVVVQTSFYFPRLRHGDYDAIDPFALTTFYVRLQPHAEPEGSLQDPVLGLHGEIVADASDPDDEIFLVRAYATGEESAYPLDELQLVGNIQLRKQIRELAQLRLVSKEGFLPRQLPKNMEFQVVRTLTGLEGYYTVEEALAELEAMLLGPYPPEEPNEMNVALEAGPLPYGPTNENFVGGKRSGRKSSRKLGTQMARRGTRRSRGIFSRLYSPIGHLLSAGKESVGAVTNTAKGVVGEGIHGLDKIGRSVTKHANMAVKDVLKRKSGGKRKTRKTRKSKRSTRRRR